jgi:uncharacterized membrane protein/protein-disulfide isomerase
MSIRAALTAGPFSSGRLLSLRLLCLAALLISAYLAWSAIRLQPVIGCSGSELIDCEHVLNSHWSKVLGIPVSVPAVGLYATLLGLLAFAGRPAPPAFQRLLCLVLSVGFLTAGWAAVWFIGLQVLVLQHLCPWCLAAHTCGLLLSLLALTSTVRPFGRMPLTCAGLLLAGSLAAVQWLTPVPATFEVIVPEYARGAAGSESIEDFSPFGAEEFRPQDGMQAVPAEAAPEAAPGDSPAAEQATEQLEPPTAQRRLWSPVSQALSPLVLSANLRPALNSLLLSPLVPEDEPKARKVMIPGTEKPIRLATADFPLLGSPQAKFIFVEMFDYTCPYCRDTNKSIRGAFERFGDDIAVIALPVPLERKCNRAASGSGHAGSCELSRLAIAVWRCDRGKFQQYHDWLFDRTRTVAAARRQAEDLVGRDSLRAQMDSPAPGNQIGSHVELYIKVGSGTVPKLLFSGSSVVGAVQKEALCSMISREMGQTPAK